MRLFSNPKHKRTSKSQIPNTKSEYSNDKTHLWNLFENLVIGRGSKNDTSYYHKEKRFVNNIFITSKK